MGYDSYATCNTDCFAFIFLKIKIPDTFKKAQNNTKHQFF